MASRLVNLNDIGYGYCYISSIIPQKTFTEVNMCDEEIRNDIEYFRTFLFSELGTEIKNRNLPESLKIDEIELVLEPKRHGAVAVCYYYFVNPRARSLFWLDEWEGYKIFKDCRGILSSPHKGKLQATGPGGLNKRFESIRSGYPSRLLVCHMRESRVVGYSRV